MPGNHTTNATTFAELLDVGEALADRRRWDAAATAAYFAAALAWRRHTGVFASDRLEGLLLSISEGSPRLGEWRVEGTDDESVLHVLSRASSTAGDLRFVQRWAKFDESFRHSVAITRQGGAPIPENLAEAIGSKGGAVYTLASEKASPIESAVALREAVVRNRCGRVLLHTYPDDVVPFLAFGSRPSNLAVAIVDQSDHTFWVGRRLADAFIALRREGAQAARELRGISPEALGLLPIPMDLPDAKPDRKAARERLGVRSSRVLLSIAVPFKYAPLMRPSLQELLTHLATRNPDSTTIVVGPDSSDPYWREASAACRGQLLLAGRTHETGDFYAAADVYIDSFPFSSNTSMLEAARRGLALVGYYPHRSFAPLLCGGSPGLAKALMETSTAEQFVEKVEALLRDPALLAGSQRSAEACLEEGHSGQPWTAAAHAALDFVDERRGRAGGTNASSEPAAASPELNDLLSQLYSVSGHDVDLALLAEAYLPKLPLVDRYTLLGPLRRSDANASRDLLLPRTIRNVYRAALRQTR